MTIYRCVNSDPHFNNRLTFRERETVHRRGRDRMLSSVWVVLFPPQSHSCINLPHIFRSTSIFYKHESVILSVISLFIVAYNSNGKRSERYTFPKRAYMPYANLQITVLQHSCHVVVSTFVPKRSPITTNQLCVIIKSISKSSLGISLCRS